jgi:hypothetical protein
MRGFKGRKTGLFKPVWEQDRFPDGLLMDWGVGKGKTTSFWALF